ncbi:MAG: thiamine pyrophosphate-binding protein, partial [Desulfobulbaceae bacterium]|nr:thiamine pyrophosphate-binding protein [Desulfobulbaceae bacterium]
MTPTMLEHNRRIRGDTGLVHANSIKPGFIFHNFISENDAYQKTKPYTPPGREIEMTTVAEVLARTIAEAGVDVVFGLPGGENTEVLDAIRRTGLEFVLVKSESSAVFMADATARLTGKPGVCLTTLGPGATNAYSGVAHAFLDRAPVLIITAQTDGRLIGKHTHQVLDLQKIFQPVTKLTCELSSKDTQGTVLKALAMLQEGRPGPVHLGLNSETAKRQVVTTGKLPDPLPPGTTQEMDHIQEAQALLAQSKCPVLVVGLGLEPEKPYAALRQLAETAHAPVIVTPKAKGSLPADHPLAAGTIGLTRTDPAYEILDEADCIVALGFDVV